MSLTRRNALTAAAAALVTSALASTSISDLHAQEVVARQLWAKLDMACTALGHAETALSNWKNRNPEPQYRRPVYKEYAGDDPKEFIARRNAWRARKATAEQQSGYNNARSQEDAINTEISELIEAVCETRAVTLEEVRCKAQIALVLEAGCVSSVAWSLVEDLAGVT